MAGGSSDVDQLQIETENTLTGIPFVLTVFFVNTYQGMILIIVGGEVFLNNLAPGT